MIIKLAALGALGYAGYRYLRGQETGQSRQADGNERVALAGGPLSDDTRVQHDAAPPPTSV